VTSGISRRRRNKESEGRACLRRLQPRLSRKFKTQAAFSITLQDISHLSHSPSYLSGPSSELSPISRTILYPPKPQGPFRATSGEALRTGPIRKSAYRRHDGGHNVDIQQVVLCEEGDTDTDSGPRKAARRLDGSSMSLMTNVNRTTRARQHYYIG
jgi:hypothetical protein